MHDSLTKALLLLLVSILSGCDSGKIPNSENAGSFDFFLGTYTNGDSEGIYKMTIDPNGKLHSKKLIAKTKDPSFIAKSHDGKFLVTVNETNINGNGGVESYFIGSDSLKLITKSLSGGAHPCHVSVNKNGFVLISNYTGGNVGLHQIDSSGRLSELLSVQQFHGKSISPRQEKPHAHSSWFVPESDLIISADLGTDKVWLLKINNKSQLELIEPQYLDLEPGSGPRHFAFHPNNSWAYLINELNSTVSFIVLNKENGPENIETVTTLPEGFTGENLCADIHLSKDGQFLYASNRGHNSIAVFKIDQESGKLRRIQHQSVEVNWPRNFSLTPDDQFLIVANQYSNKLTSYKRNSKDGTIQYMDEIIVPSPTCIVF